MEVRSVHPEVSEHPDSDSGYHQRVIHQRKYPQRVSSSEVVSVLNHQRDGGENSTLEQVRKRAKWDNDDYVCRGLILNGMSDSLFDVYQNVETSKELWDTLEAKYMAEDASSKKFLVSNFTNYKMTDSRPVLEQYNELLGILGRFTQHKMNMDESIKVSCIIDKLPPSWKDFKHTLKYLKEELTLIELGSHLRIEESLRAQDNDKPKGNNVAGPSVVNMVEHNNSSRYNDNKGKRKHHDTRANPNKKPKVTCWKCGKPGHLKKDCKAGNVGNRANGSSTKGSEDGSSMPLKVHVCKDRCWFKTYKLLNDGSILHMGNESTALVHRRSCVDLRLNIVSDNVGSAFMSTSELKDSILWHARLGHVHFKRMQDMSKDGLIPAFDMDTKNDLCDLHATPSLGNKKYFVTFIDDASRFCYVYLLHTKDEALDKFKVFKTEVKLQQGSLIKRFRTDRVVVRLLDPKLKTLGERGIECIFVGYDEHSKAFRFYVIEPNDSVLINLIIESKDTIFDENRFSSLPRLSQSLIIHQMDVKIAFLNGELEEEVDLTKEFLSSRFSMKEMGEADKFNYSDCTPISTPMDTCEKLMPNKGQSVSQLEYSRVIGCLMYAMTCNKPNIAFAVGKLSRYTNNLGTQHMQAIQRVLKYLKKTMNYRLMYYGYPLVLEGYTNVSWISNTEDNSSTSGGVFLLGGGAISWASKKQTCITSSTMESKFMALAAAGKEAKWLINLLLEIPLWVKPITPISIRCDSTATLAKAYSQMYNGKSRHLGVRHSMIRELITNGVISIEFVRMCLEPADKEDEVANFSMVMLFEKVLSRSMNKEEPPMVQFIPGNGAGVDDELQLPSVSNPSEEVSLAGWLIRGCFSIEPSTVAMVTMSRLVTEKVVVIFSKSSCCICHIVKTLICSVGANPTVYELDEHLEGQKIEKELKALGFKPSAPAEFIGQELVGGANEIMSMHLKGKIVKSTNGYKVEVEKRFNSLEKKLDTEIGALRVEAHKNHAQQIKEHKNLILSGKSSAQP
ncbi:zinc finger, CCHC-type containing protein [Tanacetum coccineum]